MNGNGKRQVGLRGKARRLNRIIEDVDNWFIILEGKEFNPPKNPDVKIWWDKHDNLVFGVRVEMHGFGEIYKICVLTSDKYLLSEIPRKMWRIVWDEIYNPDGQDAMNPLISTDDKEYEKRGLDPDNSLIFVCKWWPPDDYVNQLVLKRNFMTAPEFALWAKLIDDEHKKIGGRAPNYIIKEPFISVPDVVH
jgi:hypothetical protein